MYGDGVATAQRQYYKYTANVVHQLSYMHRIRLVAWFSIKINMDRRVQIKNPLFVFVHIITISVP